MSDREQGLEEKWEINSLDISPLRGEVVLIASVLHYAAWSHNVTISDTKEVI